MGAASPACCRANSDREWEESSRCHDLGTTNDFADFDKPLCRRPGGADGSWQKMQVADSGTDHGEKIDPWTNVVHEPEPDPTFLGACGGGSPEDLGVAAPVVVCCSAAAAVVGGRRRHPSDAPDDYLAESAGGGTIRLVVEGGAAWVDEEASRVIDADLPRPASGAARSAQAKAKRRALQKQSEAERAQYMHGPAPDDDLR